jgi:hypothetical protein
MRWLEVIVFIIFSLPGLVEQGIYEEKVEKGDIG